MVLACEVVGTMLAMSMDMTNTQRKVFCATFPKAIKGTNLCGGYNLIQVTEGEGLENEEYANDNRLALHWPSADFSLVRVGARFDMGGAALIQTKYTCYLNYRLLRK